MRAIIFLLLLLQPVTALPQIYPQWPQLQHANESLGWVVNDRRIIGGKTRVALYNGQDPFPFCAAVSASILFDQHRCMAEGRDCRTQPRVSALSLVPYSQGRVDSVIWDKGGFTQLALSRVVNYGAAAHSDCNIDGISNPRSNKTKELYNLFVSYSSYQLVKDYGGYLSRYHRDEFVGDAKSIGVWREGITSLLGGNYSNSDQLTTDIILTSDCRIATIIPDKTYKINLVKVKNFDIEVSHKLVHGLLKNNTPVAVNLCLNAIVGIEKCSNHSLVIFAEGFAKNTITGDVRKVYRVANTWGEEWQKKHGDGWVFADLLLSGIYEIMWLM